MLLRLGGCENNENRLGHGVLGALTLAAMVGVSLQPGANRAADGRSMDRSIRIQPQKPPSQGAEADSQLACDDIAALFQTFLDIDQVRRPKSCLDAHADSASRAGQV
jgi:hypothetical protein